MLKWIGTIAGIIGSLLVAMNNGLQFIGYIAFLIGALSWLIASVQSKDKAGIAQWAFFTAVNIMGIINYV
jgi:nicotinamide riboside transporter PnuC